MHVTISHGRILCDMTGRTRSRDVPSVGGPGFVVLDTETTGLHDPARVIELALVFLSPVGELQGSWSTLIKGNGSAGGPRLERIHGITDADLRGAPDFGDLHTGLRRALAGRIPIGHNSKFDRARLNYELQLVRQPKLPEMACTMYLGSHLGHGILRLDDAIEQFGIKRSVAHQAHADALATAHLLRHYLSTDMRGTRSYLSRKGFLS